MSRKKSNKSIENNIKKLLIFILFVVIATVVEQVSSYLLNDDNQSEAQSTNSNLVTASTTSGSTIDLNSIPAYTNSPYVEINNNIPSFTESDITTNAFETYSDLDSLGRCGVVYANICKEVMPAKGEKRTEISMVKPTRMENNKISRRC